MSVDPLCTAWSSLIHVPDCLGAPVSMVGLADPEREVVCLLFRLLLQASGLQTTGDHWSDSRRL